LVTYHPGDWIEVKKKRAKKLLASGKAEIPRQDIMSDVAGFNECGILIRGEEQELLFDSRIEVSFGEISLPYENVTVLLKPNYYITWKAIEAGLLRITNFEDTDAEPWEMMAMLFDNDVTADDVGTEDERAKTKELIGDLRLPVYDTDILWVRKTDSTEAVIDRWVKELETSNDEKHSFLRALYAERAMMLTLPSGWSSQWELLQLKG